MKKIWSLLLVIILVVSSALKIAEVYGGNFPFTTDQGRDMVDMRHMVVTLSPRLVGPTTSINGVLLGPFWYYFNLIPFVIGGGDPSVIVYWQILWYQIAVITLWLVIKKKNLSLANIVAISLFLMPTGFNVARYFWNANSMPFFTIFFIASLIHSYWYRGNRNLMVLGLISGLCMQVEAAFGILFFPFAFLIFLLNKTNIKQIRYLVFGFGITLIPQILFELKHGFIMTKIFLAEMSGAGNMLGEKMSLGERLAQRVEHFNLLMLRSTHLPPNYVPLLYLSALIIFVFLIVSRFRKSYESKGDNHGVWKLSFYFLLFSACFYLLFPQTLKIWYTLGLSIPLTIFLSCFINLTYQSKTVILKVFAVFLIFFTVYYSIKSQVDYTKMVTSTISNDRSNMRNELSAIDWVYTNAAGRGFRAFSYLPSVYDFPYNHLYWWYGQEKYGYHPAETAYLPNQPEYIRDVDKIWTSKRELDRENLTFLIIEKDLDIPERESAWLGNFSKLCLVKEVVFPWNARVQMRANCTK